MGHASIAGPSNMFIPQLSTLDARARDLVTHAACAIGMGVIYFLACHIALSIDITDGAASVWPASGLLFGVLLLTPNRLVPPVLLGTLVGGIVANLGVGFDAATSIGYSCINLGEGVMGRWLVRRYWPDAPRLSHPLNLFALIACGAAAAVAGAVVAATLASVTEHASWTKVLGTWAGSDIAGIVIVAPVILATAGAMREVRGPIPRWRVVEAIILLMATIGAAYWLYLSKQPSRIDQVSNPLIIVPLMGWAAIRFEAPGAAWAIFIVNTFCIWGTTIGSGPLFDLGASSLVNLVVQARVGVTGIVALSLGTAVGAARRSAGVHQRLALELQAAVDAERTRLSHELHDEVAQKLAALKMQLQLSELGRDGSTASSTTSSVAIVDDLLADVRSLSYSLRPAPFDQGQLVPALTALARVEGVRGGVRVLIESPAAELSLPRDIELVCYRVVREAVSNAVKHACARNVAVSLSCHLDRLTFSIMDDGRGFDVAPTTRQAVRDGHLGLVGMRERLGRVGGTLSISSRLGAGTTINCLVPLGAGV
jgi:signal transduction histidine kinase